MTSAVVVFLVGTFLVVFLSAGSTRTKRVTPRTQSVVITTDARVVRVSPEFLNYLLWVVDDDGGLDNITGHEIGLSAALVAELLALADELDQTFDPEYPPDSRPTAPDFMVRVFAAAQKVRDELDDEWTVVGPMPATGARVRLRKTGDTRPLAVHLFPWS